MKPEFIYDRKEQTGHGVGDDIRHYFRANIDATKAEAETWVKSEEYFGYNPAGYGGQLEAIGDTINPNGKYRLFRWVHQASCD